MNQKGKKLVQLIVVSYVLTIATYMIFDSNLIRISFISNDVLSFPFLLVFGLVSPVIFISQFPHKSIYKFLGLFFMSTHLLHLITNNMMGVEGIHNIRIMYLIYLLLGKIIFFIITFRYEDMFRAKVYLIVLIGISLLNSISYIWHIYVSQLSFNQLLVLSGIIPVILGIVALVFECRLVVYEIKD